MTEDSAEVSVNGQLSDAANAQWRQEPDPSPGMPPMTKQEAEQEAIRRWYLLPEHLRDSFEHAEAYAVRLEHELDFYTVTSRQRLIAAWLIREIATARRLEREARAAATAEAA
jgi:hypothetical protein